jgi:hypothetical protein
MKRKRRNFQQGSLQVEARLSFDGRKQVTGVNYWGDLRPGSILVYDSFHLGDDYPIELAQAN